MTDGNRDQQGFILVEGPSDKVAVETLAARRGLDLKSDAVSVIAMGGITNLGHYLDLYAGTQVRLAGMCDLGEVPWVTRRIREAGIGEPDTPSDLEDLGFWVCSIDLEDELVRSLGPERVLAVFEADGRLQKFRSFQNQPDKRALPLEFQLWDYLTNWKIHYAKLFVEALDLDHVPRPLDGVLSSIRVRQL